MQILIKKKKRQKIPSTLLHPKKDKRKKIKKKNKISQHNLKFKLEIRHFLRTVQGCVFLGKGPSKSNFCKDAAKLYCRCLPSSQTTLAYSLPWEFAILLFDGRK